jgi:4-carboxymuconolactone decarboxylase
MAAVEMETQETLSGISGGDLELLEGAMGLREAAREESRLDPRTFALVKIAALIALDAPPASYAWQVGNALGEGATPEDILGVLHAIAPQVGGPKVIAAAPEIMLALGLSLPEGDQ